MRIIKEFLRSIRKLEDISEIKLYLDVLILIPISLCREDKRAFEISREFPRMGHLSLREWQRDLISQLKVDNRKIIWIVGAKGG